MAGNVRVPEGVTLTIESGVSVLADGTYSLQIGGILRAEGSAEEEIVLTPRNSAGSWEGIQFISGTEDQTASTLTHVVIRRSYAAINVTGGRNIPKVSYSTIQDSTYGVFNGGAYRAIPMSITHSRIVGNGVGICLRSNLGSGSITHNEITGNGVGIDATYSFGAFRVNNNNLHGNSSYNIKGADVVPGTNEVTIDAMNNWWGTTNAAEIAATIYDCGDDLEVGCVTYQPFASGPISETP